MRIKSLKVQLSIFLTLFAVYLSFIDKDYFFLLSVGIAVISTVITDILLCYIKNKKIIISESAIVSGLIIGFVLSPDIGLWFPAVAGLTTSLSKNIIRWRNKHIFNPAGFGVLLSILIFGVWFDTNTQWNGAYSFYILIPFGIYLSYRARKIEIIVSYYIVYFLCFGIQAFLQKVSVVNVLEFANYFFILIMLIEPKTSPFKRIKKIIYGSIAAIIVFILYSIGYKYDADLSALLICNAAAYMMRNK